MVEVLMNNQHSELELPENVEVWYQNRLIQQTGIGRLFPRQVVRSLYDPKIFDVLKPRKAFHFAAIDAWIRMMWRDGGLSRWMREAIAVSVSIANQCVY